MNPHLRLNFADLFYLKSENAIGFSHIVEQFDEILLKERNWSFVMQA